MAVGETKDVGFQIGVSRTLPYRVEDVWELLTGVDGLGLWLGVLEEWEPVKGGRYRTDAGTVGEIRSFRENDRIRMTWRPAGWNHDSTVQVAMTPREGRTVLRFHQEWLANPDERARQREYWQRVMATVVEAARTSFGR